MDLAYEFDDDIFVFPQYGTALRQPTPPFDISHDDIYTCQPDRDMTEFFAGFRVGSEVGPIIVEQISAIVQRRWDCFMRTVHASLSWVSNSR